VFAFLDQEVLPDNMLINAAIEDAAMLGIFSSRVHVAWALAAGGRLGVGNDPRYNKTRCFETFPFPAPDGPEKERIRQLAEELDALRKARQAEHSGLTMTGMYNVLEKLRQGEPLSAKDRQIHEQGLVSVLGQLHDELDTAVFAAYGWDDMAPRLVGHPGGTTPLPDKPSDQAEAEEELLTRLVALNRERAAEEARGQIRWLRPDFQAPGVAPPPGDAGVTPATGTAGSLPARGIQARVPWPKTLPEQVQALRSALAEHTARGGPATAEELAQVFTRAPRAKVAELLATLATLGHARRLPDGRFTPG
jgi:hypothetical protein